MHNGPVHYYCCKNNKNTDKYIERQISSYNYYYYYYN